MELQCGVCLADLGPPPAEEVGELDSCTHRRAAPHQPIACTSRQPPLSHLQVLLPVHQQVGRRCAADCCRPRAGWRPAPLATAAARLAPPAAPPHASLPLHSLPAVENTCPFCKRRFSRLRRKLLASAEELAAAGPGGTLPGEYIGSHIIPERNQRVVFEDPSFQQWIEQVACLVCGGGDNEHELLLCDGGRRCAGGRARGRCCWPCASAVPAPQAQTPAAP